MGRVGQGEDIGELPRRLEGRAGILGGLLPGDELLPADEHHIDKAHNARQQEGQLIGAVGGAGGVVGALIRRSEQPLRHRLAGQLVQHPGVGKGPRRVQHAVRNGQQQSQGGLGIAAVGRLLPPPAQVLVLVGLHYAQAHHAYAYQGRGHQLSGYQLAHAAGDQAQHRHQRTGGVADGGRDGQLDIPQADIAHSHGQDVQQRHRQIGPDNVPGHLGAADEDFIRRVQPHDHAHRRDHFQVAVFIGLRLAADFGKQVRSAPAQQSDQGKPEPHVIFSPFRITF